MEGEGKYDPTGMRGNWDKELPSEGIKATVNRKVRVFFTWTADTHSNIKVLLILYIESDPESESESGPESIRSPESEPKSESEQPHHDSAPLLYNMFFSFFQSRYLS